MPEPVTNTYQTSPDKWLRSTFGSTPPSEAELKSYRNFQLQSYLQTTVALPPVSDTKQPVTTGSESIQPANLHENTPPDVYASLRARAAETPLPDGDAKASEQALRQHRSQMDSTYLDTVVRLHGAGKK